MKKIFIISALFIFYSLGFFCSAYANTVYVIQLDDATINPVTAEYIEKSIDKAAQKNAAALILKMDTPGGLLNSTRHIVKKMLTSKVPVIVYISPSGSRAGSAGVFITYASHVAAMAPTTNIGAAHPVTIGKENPKRSGDWDELKGLIEALKKNQGIPQEEVQEEKVKEKKEVGESKRGESAKKKEETASYEEDIIPDEDPLSSKILQDTVAFIRAIAKERNRNEEWAVKSVTKSLSITAEEALEKKVIEIIAKDDQDLLNQLDGRIIKIDNKDITLNTKEANIEYWSMDARQKFFNILADPNIAYFLLILGFYGLLFEITHPGTGVPGIVGGIFLILAFYSMQTLPTNYAGLALIILGLISLIAELFTPGFGVFTLGGIICMILGSLLLFETADPVMRVSLSSIAALALTTFGIVLFLVRSVFKTHHRKAQGGKEGLLGSIGKAQNSFGGQREGKIFIHGEIWGATSDEEVKKGDAVKVLEIDGLTLKVKSNS